MCSSDLGRKRRVDQRKITNAILYVLKGGISWRMLPREFAPWKTVYHYFRRKCCKDLILPKNPDFARKPPCLSASQSTTGFSAKSRKRGVFRQNRKVATLRSLLQPRRLNSWNVMDYRWKSLKRLHQIRFAIATPSTADAVILMRHSFSHRRSPSLRRQKSGYLEPGQMCDLHFSA